MSLQKHFQILGIDSFTATVPCFNLSKKYFTGGNGYYYNWLLALKQEAVQSRSQSVNTEL